jgi:hypothetical protein
MDIQVVIVAIMVVAAIAYVARSIFKSAKGNSCETGNCGCEKKLN